uniref:C2H2-type domain-containing protein n=2 Tax=Parascaris TaxID=6254 RepID=A0A915AFR4_PARUN
MRREPRIISRKRLHPSLTVDHQRYAADERTHGDIDDDIGEGVVVRGGVMMRLLPDEDHFRPMPQREPPMQFPRHITVEAPPLPFEGKPYVENPLPGIADEVESYPCRYCPERIFLTSFGLERHTKMAHPDRLGEALLDIHKIQEEWRRREKERTRQRERAALAKLRQEALTHVLSRGRDSYVYGGDVDDISVHGVASTNLRAFEPCRICGIYINAQHPSAMINHMRAHTKNDELRSHMLAEFGEQYVERVTCRECHLVFSDESKLMAHIHLMHSRRRKYVCKWCGHVCTSMADLNMHKADVHGQPVTRSREDMRRRTLQANVSRKIPGVERLNIPLGMTTSARPSTVMSADALRSSTNGKLAPGMGDTPCRTSCEICGLVMVKPSLLIRHMLRVHNRQCFSATIQVRGMPDIKAEVDKGRVTWWCCGSAFFDRYQFMYHRRSCHQPKYNLSNNQTDTVVLEGTVSTEERSQQVVSSTDPEVLHLVEAEQSSEHSGDIFVLLVADQDTGGGKDDSAWGEGEITAGMQQIALTAEQYEQLRVQIDGDLNNMQVVFMDEEGEPVASTSLANSVPSSGGAFIPIDSLVPSMTEPGATPESQTTAGGHMPTSSTLQSVVKHDLGTHTSSQSSLPPRN